MNLRRAATCHPQRPHRAKGLCASCYRKTMHAKHREAALARMRARYRADPAKYKARARAWDKAHPDKARKSARASGQRWYKRNSDRIAARNRQRVYGLSAADYVRKLAAQGGRCAICRQPTKHRLCVDHCHKTDKVRGLLCRRCNLVIGNAQEDTRVLKDAVVYLEHHQ